MGVRAWQASSSADAWQLRREACRRGRLGAPGRGDVSSWASWRLAWRRVALAEGVADVRADGGAEYLDFGLLFGHILSSFKNDIFFFFLHQNQPFFSSSFFLSL